MNVNFCRGQGAKAFTLIELLIVIAVLGILATAVLVAINPIEQMNRGKDTGSRSDAKQLLGAVERYLTSRKHYPWQTGELDTENTGTAWGWADETWADGNGVAVLTKLSSSINAEVRNLFISQITRSTYNKLFRYNRGTGDDNTYICFLPKSAQFQQEARVRCGTNCSGLPLDLVDAGCENVCPGGATGYYSCLP